MFESLELIEVKRIEGTKFEVELTYLEGLFIDY